jgi:hypothetical protein
MSYTVNATPAEGYVFRHWEAWYRSSNSPDDFLEMEYPFNTTGDVVITLFKTIGNTKIKSPLSYLVAHFKPIAASTENDTPSDISEPETPEDIENTTENSYTKQDILDAIDRLLELVKKVMA